jgi:predicted transcriptional regulator
MGISLAESVVMEALWRRAPLSADEIVDEVARSQGWGDATVKTLLNRLLRKKAVAAKKDGRKYLYTPVLKRADYVSRESRDLIDRLFNGRFSALVTHFSHRGKLSAEDVAELKRLIAGLDDGR